MTRATFTSRVLAHLAATPAGVHTADLMAQLGARHELVCGVLGNLLKNARIAKRPDPAPGKAHNRHRYFALEHAPAETSPFAKPVAKAYAARSAAQFVGEADYSRAVVTRYVAPANGHKAVKAEAVFGELGIGRYL